MDEPFKSQKFSKRKEENGEFVKKKKTKKHIIVKKQRNLYVMILYLIPELMLC